MSMSTSSSASIPSLTTWGAARRVTGSMHLVQTARHNILLDCGLILEKGSQLSNRQFPFDPYQVDAVLLTHAHLDHCGNLPTLVSQGFRGPVYCTSATRDLLLPMLYDAANVQSFETAYYNNRREEGQPWLPPLYHQDDVDKLLELIKPVKYRQEVAYDKDITFQFRDAGHVLGSASIHMQLEQGQQPRSLTFTGDLGRMGTPLLSPPDPLLTSDLILSEATYGGQVHEPYSLMEEQLAEYVEATIERGGKVLIPAFSLGRVQLVVFTLIQLIEQGKLSRVPIYVDSPLSNRVLDIMLNQTGFLSPAVQEMCRNRKPFLHTNYVHYITSVEESKDVMFDASPSVVIASSGMGEGGRIVHHLKQSIDDPRCTVILVSFQSPGSLGARLLEETPIIRFAGRDWNKWADVKVLRGFSGHADHDELLQLIIPAMHGDTRVKLVHGEEPALLAMQQSINEIHARSCTLAEPGEMSEI